MMERIRKNKNYILFLLSENVSRSCEWVNGWLRNTNFGVVGCEKCIFVLSVYSFQQTRIKINFHVFCILYNTEWRFPDSLVLKIEKRNRALGNTKKYVKSRNNLLFSRQPDLMWAVTLSVIFVCKKDIPCLIFFPLFFILWLYVEKNDTTSARRAVIFYHRHKKWHYIGRRGVISFRHKVRTKMTQHRADTK
jgi:hypothetical protein